jgi:hypothetical protein
MLVIEIKVLVGESEKQGVEEPRSLDTARVGEIAITKTIITCAGLLL